MYRWYTHTHTHLKAFLRCSVCVHSGSFASITSAVCLLILILSSSALRTKAPSHGAAGPCWGSACMEHPLTSHQYHWEMVAAALPSPTLVLPYRKIVYLLCFHSQYQPPLTMLLQRAIYWYVFEDTKIGSYCCQHAFSRWKEASVVWFLPLYSSEISWLFFS